MASLGSDTMRSIKVGHKMSLHKSSGVQEICAIASPGVPYKETDKSERAETLDWMNTRIVAPVKDVAVGAGARINQQLTIDKTPLTEYIPEAQGIIRLYFVFEEELKGIVAKGGIKEYINTGAGYMKDLPVG